VVQALPEDQATLAKLRLDSVEGAFAFRGGEKLTKSGLGRRERIRLFVPVGEGPKEEWYLKRYLPRPWYRRLLSRLRPCAHDPAGAEYANSLALREAGIPAVRAVAFGRQRGALGVVRSYAILRGVGGKSLEKCLDQFLDRHINQTGRIELFTLQLAGLASRLHQAGFVHRDFYACHIFLRETPGGLELRLIDLARVFRPKWRKFRWRVKDLAQLRYSMPDAWVKAYWRRFLEEYLGAAAERKLPKYSLAVERKVAEMVARDQRRKQQGRYVSGKRRRA
jgi:tRNA A-37 threonylcarbamoyl transferase component Bud32